MKFPRKRTVAYVFLGLAVMAGIGTWGAITLVKARFFREHPNRLAIDGDLSAVPFEWAPTKHGDYTEVHGAILLPVTVPGIEKQLYMQFDTGSPSTFLRSGCLKSLVERGVECEVYDDDGTKRVRELELNVGENRVVLSGGWVMQRQISIDWEKPYNVIGSIGADFIDERVCAFDFPSQKLHLFKQKTPELKMLGAFGDFRFPGRRIMLPAEVEGTEMELLYDSGCSPFGLFTSKYHFDRYGDEDAQELSLNENSFGNAVPVHHKPCSLPVRFGDVEVPIERVSYTGQYVAMQSWFGGFVDGGFMGNKFLLNSTLILDSAEKQFLLLPRSLSEVLAESSTSSEPMEGSIEALEVSNPERS
ncbi:MAG: hypothetical protein AAGG44_14730 [Planctomycetota bacterium]